MNRGARRRRGTAGTARATIVARTLMRSGSGGVGDGRARLARALRRPPRDRTACSRDRATSPTKTPARVTVHRREEPPARATGVEAASERAHGLTACRAPTSVFSSHAATPSRASSTPARANLGFARERGSSFAAMSTPRAIPRRAQPSAAGRTLGLDHDGRDARRRRRRRLERARRRRRRSTAAPSRRGSPFAARPERFVTL